MMTSPETNTSKCNNNISSSFHTSKANEALSKHNKDYIIALMEQLP